MNHRLSVCLVLSCWQNFRLVVLLLSLWLTAPQLFAQSVNDSFVTRKIRGSDVLSVNTELTRASSQALAVARVTISNPKRRSIKDRNLVVTLYVANWGAAGEAFSVSVPVQLAEGAQTATVDLPFAAFSGQLIWDLAVFEAGREIEDKSGQASNRQTYQWLADGGQSSGFAAIVGSRETVADVQEQVDLLSDSPYLAAINRNNMTTTIGGRVATPRVSGKVVAVKDMPTDWRYLFPYVSWTLSTPTLREINDSHPAVAAALRTYVSAGGKLFVHSASSSQAQRDEVAKLLRGERGHLTDWQWNSESTARRSWWLNRAPGLDGSEEAESVEGDESDKVTEALAGMGVESVDTVQELKNRAAKARKLRNASAEPAPLSMPGIRQDAFVLAETYYYQTWQNDVENIMDLSEMLGVDQVMMELGYFNFDMRSEFNQLRYQVASASESERIEFTDFAAGRVFLAKQPLLMMDEDFLWSMIVANSHKSAATLAGSGLDGGWFWRNLIEAVGKPPVWAFASMVALFGAVLGPGLLFLTARMQRRSLMLFFVPALALVATAAIVVYGVLHEGFDSHVRVISVSHIDSDARCGFAWSRQNYFSGLPPREGLVFDRETLVRPVAAVENNSYSNRSPRDDIEYRISIEGEQNRWLGWLKPRQQQQLLVGHRLENPTLPLRVVQGETLDEIRIENLTSETLPFVVVRGAANDYYLAEDVAPGASVSVLSKPEADVESAVAKLMVDRRPTPPPEMQDGGTVLSFGNSRGRFRASQLAESEDVIKTPMDSFLSDRLEMPPYTFATILKENPAIEVPLDGKRSDEMHILIGTQSW